MIRVCLKEERKAIRGELAELEKIVAKLGKEYFHNAPQYEIILKSSIKSSPQCIGELYFPNAHRVNGLIITGSLGIDHLRN